MGAGLANGLEIKVRTDCPNSICNYLAVVSQRLRKRPTNRFNDTHAKNTKDTFETRQQQLFLIVLRLEKWLDV